MLSTQTVLLNVGESTTQARLTSIRCGVMVSILATVLQLAIIRLRLRLLHENLHRLRLLIPLITTRFIQALSRFKRLTVPLRLAHIRCYVAVVALVSPQRSSIMFAANGSNGLLCSLSVI